MMDKTDYNILKMKHLSKGVSTVEVNSDFLEALTFMMEVDYSTSNSFTYRSGRSKHYLKNNQYIIKCSRLWLEDNGIGGI